MPTSPVRVSIVLPTRNGAEDLAQLLPALARQDYPPGYELLAIDSASTDDSVALLEQHGARVERIALREFQHGATRNRCAARARGKILVFLSQDSIPADADFLTAITAPFEDERVAGVSARVMPNPEDDPLTMRTVLDLPESGDEGYERDLGEAPGLWALEPAERGQHLRFNNVAGAIRGAVFDRIPFPNTTFGEDFAWAARALTAGWKIRFAPEAVVRHAHCYRPRGAFQRYRVDAEFHSQIHGWSMRPNLLSATRGFFYEVGRDVSYLARTRVPGRWGALLRSPFLRAAQVSGQYVGSRGRGPRIWSGNDRL